jgi:hypothetical protein
LRFNVAMLLLPAALVALAAPSRPSLAPWIAVLAALALLVAQPDASQATTLAAVAVLIAARNVQHPIIRIVLIGGAALIAGAAWFRPDPLEPVAEVEQIIGLAFAHSPATAALALLLLIATAAAPVVATLRSPPSLRLAGMSLGACLLLWSAMPFLGAFPTPLVGMGMSPILGAWLGVGLLAAQVRGRAS